MRNQAQAAEEHSDSAPTHQPSTRRRPRGVQTSPRIQSGPISPRPAPAESSSHPSSPLARQIEVLDELIVAAGSNTEKTETLKQTRALIARLQDDQVKPLPTGQGFETFAVTIPSRCASEVRRFVTGNPGVDPGAVIATGFECWCATEKEDTDGSCRAEELGRMLRLSKVQGSPAPIRTTYSVLDQIAVVEKMVRQASVSGLSEITDRETIQEVGALQATRDTLRSLLPVAAPLGYRVQLPKGAEHDLRQFLHSHPGLNPEAAITGMVEQWFATSWDSDQIDEQVGSMMRIQSRQRIARIHPKGPRGYLVLVDAKAAGILERLAIAHRRDVHHLLSACVRTQVVGTGAYEGEDFELEILAALLETSDELAKARGAQTRVERSNAFAFTADTESARIIADLAGKHRRPVELIVAGIMRMHVAKGSIDIDNHGEYDPEMVDLLLDNCNIIEDGKEAA